DAELLRKRAKALGESGQFRRAWEDHLAAGRSLSAQRRWPEAVRDYQSAIDVSQQDTTATPKDRARIHFELAELQLNRVAQSYTAGPGDVSRDARKHFLDAVNLDGKVWEYHNGLARCHERLREWADARREYEKAIELNPDNIGPRASLAGSLVQLGDWTAAA